MRPSPVRHRRAAGLSAVLVLSLVGLTSSNALAWNQEYKSLTDPNAIGDCANTSTSPCVEWAKTSGNLSVTVYMLLGHFLHDEEVDMFTDAYNAQFTYNDIAARNPHLVQTTDSSIDDFTVTTVDDPNLLPFFAYAVTTNTIGSSPAYHITHSVLKFNRNIVWNRSLNFNCTSTVCNADSRKVANHEFGHMEGLGHESSSVTSVMRQGALTFYQVQTDDRNGIIAIYGAYP